MTTNIYIVVLLFLNVSFCLPEKMPIICGSGLAKLLLLLLKERDIAKEDGSDIPHERAVPVNVSGTGYVLSIGTTSKVFSLNYGLGIGTSAGSGIAVLENNIRVGGIILNPQRKGWLISVPNNNNQLFSRTCSIITSQENILIGANVAGVAVNTSNPIFYFYNVGIGSNALYKLANLQSNSYNTAVGYCAGANLEGGANICIGAGAMMGARSIASQIYNFETDTATSAFVSGNNNIALGTLSLSSLSSTNPLIKNDQNIALGLFSGYGINAGNNNICIGTATMTNAFSNNFSITAITFPTQQNIAHNIADYFGSYNIAMGYLAFQRIQADIFSGNGNIAIGKQSASNIAAGTNNAIFIGTAGPNNAQKGTYIGNMYGHVLTDNIKKGTPHTVYANSMDELGVVGGTTSSVGAVLQTTQGSALLAPPMQLLALEQAAVNELYRLPVSSVQYLGDSSSTQRYRVLVDKVIAEPDIIQLASLAIYSIDGGDAVAFELSDLIPLLVIAYQKMAEALKCAGITYPVNPALPCPQ